MQDLHCLHTNNYACGFGCRNFWLRRRHQANPKVLAQTLPSWTYSASRSAMFDESGEEESRSGQTIKRRRCGELTFVEGSFRPLIILDDDPDDSEVISRPLLRAGKVKDDPIILDDEISNFPAAAILLSHGVNTQDAKESLSETMTNASLSDTESYMQLASESTPYSLSQSSIGWEDDLIESSTQWGFTQLDGLIKNRSISLPPAVRPCMDGTPLASWSSVKVSSPWFDKVTSQALNNHLSKLGPKKAPRDTMPIEDRKRFFIHTPTPAMIAAMRRCVSLTYSLLDAFREPKECWLHPLPPSPKRNGRARGTITHVYKWADPHGSHSLAVNLGIVALIVESALTEAQKEGYINYKWHLSHLCGNWTCCNWRHLTVEPGSINISRNACFMLPETCMHHTPPCMKTWKRRLPIANVASMEDYLRPDSEDGEDKENVVDQSSFSLPSRSDVHHKVEDNLGMGKQVHEALKTLEDTESEDSNVDGEQTDRSGREDAPLSAYI